MTLLDVSEKHENLSKLGAARLPWRGFLPFVDVDGNTRRHVWSAICQLQFKPSALLLWGVDTSQIFSIVVGNRSQGYVSAPGFPIPAQFFATARSYEKLVEEFDANGIAPPAWITWERVLPGQQIVLDFSGPCTAALMLGEAMI